MYYNYYKLEQREDILQQMRTFSGGRNTVPQIFFNSEHLGGSDDVHKVCVLIIFFLNYIYFNYYYYYKII